MADLAEILMLEHFAIKNSRWLVDSPFDYERFTKFHSYLRACHIEVEESICFPLLEQTSFPDSTIFNNHVERIKADHKLIDTLAQNILKWYESGNTKTLAERMPLFYRLLVDHNASEETDLFPRWSNLDINTSKAAVRDALSLIESFGRSEYMEVLGINYSAFRYFFKSSL
ncbi:MAG: hemerythrin domain-containing protein [Thermoplasmataceae archaeon]|jgi:hemerythrin superfamily protein